MNRTKKFTFWLLQILPPACLLTLAAIPFNLGNVIFWGPAYIFGIISIITLVAYVVKNATKKNVDSLKLTRPILTIFVLIITNISLSYSMHTAKDFAQETAIAINKECQSGKCPEFIQGWGKRTDSYRSDIMAGNLAKYRILYGVSKDLQDFSILVKFNLDHFWEVDGGVGKKVNSKGNT